MKPPIRALFLLRRLRKESNLSCPFTMGVYYSRVAELTYNITVLERLLRLFVRFSLIYGSLIVIKAGVARVWYRTICNILYETKLSVKRFLDHEKETDRGTFEEYGY